MLQPPGSWPTLRPQQFFWGASRCEGCATGCWRWSPAVRPGWPRRPSWRSPRASMSVGTAKWSAPAISAVRAPIAGACRPSPAGRAASFLPAVSSTARNASASACAAPGAAEVPLHAAHTQRARHGALCGWLRPHCHSGCRAMTLLAPARHLVERVAWWQPAVESRRFGRGDHVAFLPYQQICALGSQWNLGRLWASGTMEPVRPEQLGGGRNRAEQENRRRGTPVRSCGARCVPSRRVCATEAWWPGS